MKKIILSFIVSLLLASPAWAVKNYYVDATAATNGDGLTWETAANVLDCNSWAFKSAAVTAATTEPVYIWISGTWDTGEIDKRTLNLNAGFNGSTYDIVIDGAPDGKDQCRIIAMSWPHTSGWSSEGGGVYSKYFAAYQSSYTFALEDADTKDQLVQRVSSLVDCQSTANTYYYDSETSTIYWHTSDDGDANSKMFSIGHVPAVGVGHDTSHITIKNLIIRGGNVNINDTDNADGTNDYITVIGCNIRYVPVLLYAGIAVKWDSSDYHWFEGNTIQDTPVGIYLMGYHNLPERTHDHCTIRDNLVMNTGLYDFNAKPDDDHGLAQQGGNYNVWEDNIVINTGYGFASFPFGGQDSNYLTFRRNFLMTGHDFGTNVNGGIVESLYDSSSTDGCAGTRYYQNIVSGFTYGARPTGYATGADTALWDSNIFYNCTQAFRTYRNSVTSVNSAFKARNNVFLNNTYHIYLASGATSGYSYEFSYNLYYPNDGSRFWSQMSSPQSGNFAWWTTLENFGTGTLDPDTTGSAVDDPSFLNAETGSYTDPLDFQIPSTSPARDSGTNVGLPTDYWGTSLPQYGQYDIGIHEYFLGETPPDVNIQTGVGFSGVGMQ